MSKPAQFEALLADYRKMVFSTAFRLLSNTADAEDITQEVFLRLWNHYPERVGLLTVGGWLKSVTRNLCLNHLERYRARYGSFSDLDIGGEHQGEMNGSRLADTAAEEADLPADEQRVLIDLVVKALPGLPPDQRAALMLYHFSEMDYCGVADRLGVSLGKVKTDIRRARHHLRRRLQPARDSLGA